MNKNEEIADSISIVVLVQRSTSMILRPELQNSRSIRDGECQSTVLPFGHGYVLINLFCLYVALGCSIDTLHSAGRVTSY